MITKQEKIKLIKDICCDAMGVKWEEVNTAKRTDALVKTRHLIMYFLWKYTRLGLKEIGAEFAHPFHTSSVIYCRDACSKLELADSRIFSLMWNIKVEFSKHGMEPTRLIYKSKQQ